MVKITALQWRIVNQVLEEKLAKTPRSAESEEIEDLIKKFSEFTDIDKN
jgi:hypothetical protein